MMWYGGDTDKGTWLYSTNRAALDDLANHTCPKAAVETKTMVVHSWDQYGKRCVQGGPDLKPSQARRGI
eukprot:2388210-Alexandrium_andersonii.AAC.1